MSETQHFSLLPGDRFVWDAVRPTEISATSETHLAPPPALQSALRAKDEEIARLREWLKDRDRTISDLVEAAEDMEMEESSESAGKVELLMAQYLLNSSQDREQIFEAQYKYECRAHARTREELDAAFSLIGVQQERMEWMLGGPWPGKHGEDMP